MNTTAWILTWLLAVVFAGAAALKLLLAKPALHEKGLPWVDDFSQSAVRGIALAELAGAVGLVLPWMLDIARILTPLAAAGLAIVMVAAFAVHMRRGETVNTVPTVVLGVLCICLAVIRFRQL